MRTITAVLASLAIALSSCADERPPPANAAPTPVALPHPTRATDLCGSLQKIERGIDDNFVALTVPGTGDQNARTGTEIPAGFERCEATGYAPRRFHLMLYECMTRPAPTAADREVRLAALTRVVGACLHPPWTRVPAPTPSNVAWEGKASRPGLRRVCELSVADGDRFRLSCGEFEPD